MPNPTAQGHPATPAVTASVFDHLPDSALLRDKARRNRGGMGAPSLLTGPSGAAPAPVGRATLLGQ